MAPVRWVSVVEVLVLSGALLAAETGTELDAKAAKHFKPQWSSVQYYKSVTVENPALSQTPQASPQTVSETVTLSCQVEIGEPNLILGVSSEGVITQITDSNGQEVAVSAPAGRPRQRYEPLRYRPRYRQEEVPRWKRVIAFVMRRPPPTPGPPQLVNELEPSRMSMRFDRELLGQAGGELKSVKGYFHALVAGSIENIDVPFEPNDAWVRLTPDVEIQVKEAVNTPGSHRFWIEQRPQGGAGMRPLGLGQPQPLPARMVVNRQFIQEDGKPSRQGFSPPFLPASIAGRGSGGGGSRIKAIRFVIAVDPAERKIPFEFSNIPLPNPEQ